MTITKSKDNKISIIQDALEYAINDTELCGNLRRDAILIQMELETISWNDLLNYNSMFLSLITSSLEKLNSIKPNAEYQMILDEIYNYIDNESD